MKEIYIDRAPDFDRVAIRWDRIEESIDVMKKTGVKNLAINSVWGWKKGKTLKFLEDNTWIEGINLVEEDLDISVLNRLRDLRVLALSADRYKGELNFENFPGLVRFGGPWISKQFKNLDKCLKLKNITIRRFPWNDFIELANMKELVDLELNYGKLTSLKGIQSLKSLQRLLLYSHPALVSLEGLENLDKNLKKLMLQNCKKIEDYAPIEGLNNLEVLNLSESAPIKSVKFIRNMKKLVHCYIGTEILDMDPEPLKERGFEFKRSKNYR